jgi:aryl-alcohol dehydrogenase-like predicted oxidoreductase
MPMSYPGRPPEHQAITTIHAALDAGVTLIDTSPSYHDQLHERGHSEELVARALEKYGGSTHEVLVATKAGHVRQADGTVRRNGQPDHLKLSAKESAERLGREVIDLLQFHNPDPAVPYAESIGALHELVEEGVVRMVGVSNASVDQVQVARQTLGEHLVSVQNRFSPLHRESWPVLELCDQLGLAFLPWSPLGGLRETNAQVRELAGFAEIASSRGVSPQQVCLAWELSLSPVVIPIPGASRATSVVDSARASDLVLTEAELAELPDAGVMGEGPAKPEA